MSLMFTIHTVAEHPHGGLTEHTYTVTANNKYAALDQIIDNTHAHGLTLVSWTIQDKREITLPKGPQQ